MVCVILQVLTTSTSLNKLNDLKLKIDLPDIRSDLRHDAMHLARSMKVSL